MNKELIGWISVGVTILSVVPYYYFVCKHTIKPHAFSWFIWGVLTAIGFTAQMTEGAGAGAWATGVVSIACLGIAALALKYGERNITRSDWVCFIAAIAAIPLWVITDDPLGSVILISVIDVLGYIPTIRKSYHKPYEELMFTHVTGTLKYVFALLAMENWTLTTWLYPAAICSANVVLVALLLWRRQGFKNRCFNGQ